MLLSLANSANGTISRAAAITRPVQAAPMVAASGRWLIFQIPARSIRPPSSGSPGSRLNSPTSRLAHISWVTSTCAVPKGISLLSPYPTAARTSEIAGPAAATRNSLAGVGASFSISENPPSGYSSTRRTGNPNARATRQ